MPQKDHSLLEQRLREYLTPLQRPLTMARHKNLEIHEVLGLPGPEEVGTPDLQEQYSLFLEQLRPDQRADIILSDPYFFHVEPHGIHESLDVWLTRLNSKARTRLTLLLLLCRPFDYDKVWPDDHPRFVAQPLIKLFLGTPSKAPDERTHGAFSGVGGLDEHRKALDDPSMKLLIDSLLKSAAIETLTSGLFSNIPGIVDYQAWQICDWSPKWASVYGLTDAAHPEGYPFPWFLGFCRKDRLERNFIELLRGGAEHYDSGFYSTYGDVSGDWRLASMALSIDKDDQQPRWDVIDQLLDLDEAVLESLLEEGPEDNPAFILRIAAILEEASVAGFGDDACIKDLLAAAGDRKSLAGIEEKLPEWQSGYEERRTRERAERAEELLPFQEKVDSWASTAAGTPPSSRWARIGWSTRKRHIKSYLEAYVLEHRAFPTGCHDLGHTGPTGMFDLEVGMIDFDAVARRAEKTDQDGTKI